MSKSILGSVRKKTTSKLGELYNVLMHQAATTGSTVLNSQDMGEFVQAGLEKLSGEQAAIVDAALESLDKAAVAAMAECHMKAHEDSLESGLESLDGQHIGGRFDVANMSSFTQLQRDAAALGALAATNPKAVWHRQQQINKDNYITQPLGSYRESAGTVDVGRVSAALEAYSEQNVTQTQVMSYVYNLAVSRQDVFTETVWPTILVAPDEIGITVTMQVLSVQEEYFRDISGRLKTMFGRKNLAKALIYNNILNHDTTRVVPIYIDTDPVNKSNFVDTAVVPAEEIELENGFTVKTAPLKMNNKEPIDLLGISQADYLVSAGLLNETDQLDGRAALQTLYVKLKNGKVLKFSNLNLLPMSQFTPSAHGSTRGMNLNFSHPHVVVSPETHFNDQSEIDGVVKTSKLTVRLHLDVRGDLNVNDAYLRLSAPPVGITDVHNEDSEKVAMTDPLYTQVEQYFDGAEIIGFKIEARRINTNRRETGQLLAMNEEAQPYRVGTQAPITWRRSVTGGAEVDDATKLENLIKTTYIRSSIEGVTNLLAANEHLATLPKGFFEPELVDNNTCLGIARNLIDPYHREYHLDVYQEINSLRTNDRIVDVNAVLINAFRDAWYRAYIHSGYEAGCRVLYGANAPKPRVTIATDPYIAMYLTVDGDTRTFGNGFEVDVVSTSDIRMRGHVFIIPGKFSNSTNNDAFNPLHFGNRLCRPEIVTALPIDRGGQTSHEITVQPSMEFIVQCPLMVHFTIAGLDKAVAEMVPLYKEEVDKLSKYLTTVKKKP